MLNLTPHPITIRTKDGDITLPPSGMVARLTTHERVVPDAVVIDGNPIPVVRRSFGTVDNLPPEGEPCIVSALVLDRVPGRHATYAPDTGPTAIRDKDGRIIAVTRLVAA